MCAKDASKEEIAKKLEHAVPFLRTVLGDRMGLRRVPALVFHYDEAFDSGVRMSELLAQLRASGEMGTGPEDGDVDVYQSHE
jgi:ribosome-binding factor A